MIENSLLAASLVGFGGLAALGATAAVYRNISGFQPFLYANSRLVAKASYLLGEKKQKELASCDSITSLAIALEGTVYSTETSGAGDLRSFQSAVEKSFVRGITELREICPKELNPFFDAYLAQIEAKIIKTIYRSRFGRNGEPVEIEKDLLFEVGSIDSFLLAGLLGTKTTRDIGLAMSETIYAPVFSSEYANESEFENALDLFVCSRLADLLMKTRMHEIADLREVFNARFDIMNLKVILKAKIRETGSKETKKLLVKNDTIIYRLSDELINAKNAKEFAERCSKTTYGKALLGALAEYEKDGNYMHFEEELGKEYKKLLDKKMEQRQPFGPYTLANYLLRKEKEERNLLAISSCIEKGFPTEKILSGLNA